MYPVAVLAGGVASRMRPLTAVRPKAMIPVAGQPFIAHQLALLRDRGVQDVVLCVGHLADEIRSFVGDGARWALRVRYSEDGQTLLGTGGAIRQALPLVGSTFFVMYGDSYLRCDFAAVATAFAQSGRDGLMTVYRNRGQLGASNLRVEQGEIARYDKQATGPDMEHIDYGLSVLTAPAFDRYPAQAAFDLAQVFQDLIARHRLAAFEVSERFYEIGSFDGLRDTEALLRSGSSAT